MVATLMQAIAVLGITMNCTTEWDCSLNGKCVNGGCVCEKPWTGPVCSHLDQLPAKTTACGDACAYHGLNQTWTSWGGQVQKAKDGNYYMAVSEFSSGCNLGTWRCNSQVAFAKSTNPLGPFERLGVAVEPWAHNAALITIGDQFAIYSLGDGYDCAPGSLAPPTTNCSAGCHVKCPPRRGNAHALGRGEAMFRVHYAKSIAEATTKFPWNYVNTTLNNYSWSFPGNWNPAPFVMKNGSVRVMAHDSWHSMAGEAIMQSDSGFEGPYNLISDDQQLAWEGTTRGSEDPFYWIDPKGHHHVLYHRINHQPGGHAWSYDGLKWSNISESYTGQVMLEGGKKINTNRQRPKLLFNDGGIPTHLYNGAGVGKETYTIVVPLNV